MQRRRTACINNRGNERTRKEKHPPADIGTREGCRLWWGVAAGLTQDGLSVMT